MFSGIAFKLFRFKSLNWKKNYPIGIIAIGPLSDSMKPEWNCAKGVLAYK